MIVRLFDMAVSAKSQSIRFGVGFELLRRAFWGPAICWEIFIPHVQIVPRFSKFLSSGLPRIT